MTNEATGSGYIAGGKVLVGKTLTDNGNRELVFDAADLVWPTVTVSFRYVVLYDDTAPGKPLIAVIDFGTTKIASAQDLTLEWQYEGINSETGEQETVPGILVLSY